MNAPPPDGSDCRCTALATRGALAFNRVGLRRHLLPTACSFEPSASIALIDGRATLVVFAMRQQALKGDPPLGPLCASIGDKNMDRWRVELGAKDKYLGIVEAEDEDEAVETAAEKFRVPASERHKIMVSKTETGRD